ncbi:hypothetical protein JOC86_003059 [Bacillus pakistanensis]|uniref:Uncharacterized protein n=1 Tax=Rossellomorea pakistanensis TaxID=992288 RepID=A0ABS2NF86_9BACI|nr:hypothetical protein [Bacillus pakistanensis]MBM7586507.1 hypothetical protein [Bacillus pakistanensis]
MNQAVVLAAQEFLGFEICSSLLECGYEVKAFDQTEDLAAKWLEIGRNANIQYSSMNNVPDLSKKFDVYLPIYDLINQDKQSKLYEFIKGFIKEKEGLISNTIMVFPLNEREKDKDNPGEQIRGFFRNLNTSISTYYLPTLFGPYQPKEYLFQKILTEENTECLNQFIDDPISVIYVKDAADVIVNHDKGEKDYLLLSSIEDSWKKALSKIHSSSELYVNKKREIPSDLEVLKVKPSLTFQEVLDLQRKSF